MSSKLYESFLQKNPSPQERLDLGKSIRKQINRSSIAEFKITNQRQSPIDILLEQAKSRIPEYIPIRHARMAVDTFAFFRGGALENARTPEPILLREFARLGEFLLHCFAEHSS